MELMQAFVRREATNGEVSMAEVPVPQVGDHEVLVQVRAFGVGLHDRWFIPPDARFPYVIGTEAAGVVVETGTGVETFGPGDRVMLSGAPNPKGGTWAEFAVVGETSLTRMPDALDFPAAAGIPVAGKTAVESLHTLDLRSGDTLFVAGASGAIGTLVVQMAVARGIRVAGSASARNHDYLLSLGAEKAVDYNASDWHDQVRQWAPGGVDAALAIQPGTGASSQFVVREDGHVVTVSGDTFEPERTVRVEQFVHRADARRDMAALLAAITDGQIRLVLERIYPFEEAVAALEKTETRHARGKLVVTAAGTQDARCSTPS
ncbi:MAG: NADP-dependent oxidoreductase [Solirubrobacteraceae bacterium]|nr:NADP-dependent oxidoreductase [Solirubrobacteraceae bacterium]